MLRRVMLGVALAAGLLTVQETAAQSPPPAASTTAPLTETQKVDRLIQYIRSLEAAYIRNGSEHTCQEAADHLQAKWAKHRSRISSAEEFIERLASESSMTGEPYLIRYADGKTATTEDVLRRELSRLEQQ